MKRLVLAVVALSMMALPAMAQDAAPAEPNNPVPSEIYGKKSAIALNFGAIGVGLEYAYNFHPKLNGRFRVSTLPYTLNDFSYDFDGNPTVIDADINFLNFDLLVELLPFKNSSFKVVAGLSYFANANVDALVNYDGTFTYGDIVLTEEEIGNFSMGIDYTGIAPYLGIGFGRAVPRKRLGFGMEMGAYYVGAPKITLASTGVLEDTAENNLEKFQENMNSFAFLPYFQFRLAYRIN